MDHAQEREIIKRVLAGERQEYALLVDAYKGPVFNLAFRMTGSYSDADDLTQETFIRAYQKLEQFHTEKSFFTWLYTISINLLRNHLKKKRWDVKHQTMDYFLKGPQPPENDRNEGGGLEDNISRLETQMQRLPVDLRETILLRFQQELTFEEIAAITGGSLSAVKMRIYRGLEKLKSMMDPSRE
jgi:RNA polymerase sigma-70 factor (ECF subfamily)